MPLLWIALGLAAGVAAAAALDGLGFLPFLAAAGGLALLLASFRRPDLRFPALALLAAALGAWRFQAVAAGPLGTLGPYVDREVTLRGRVETPERRDERGRYVLAVDEADVDGRPLTGDGRVLVRTNAYPERQAGDYVEVTGLLERPPVRPDFAYADYLARRGIGWMMDYPRTRPLGHADPPPPSGVLAALSARFTDALDAALPEPQASLARGLLLGTGGGFPTPLTDALAATGTLHIVAVSGYNITVVAGALTVLAIPLAGRRRAAYFVLPALVAYVLLVGAAASVVRAAIMGGLVVLAYHFGRQRSIGHALALAVALMLAVKPLWIAEPGFQLSVLATLGLVFLTPLAARVPYDRLLPGHTVLQRAAAALGAELAATLAPALATLPVVVASFGRLSLVAPLVNLVVAPLIPPAMLGAFLAGLGGSLFPPLGTALGELAWLPLSAILAAIHLGAALPFAALETGPAPAWAAPAIYLIAVAGVLAFRFRGRLPRPTRPAPPRLAGPLPYLGLTGLAVLGWTLVLTEDEPRLTLSVLGVGSEATVLVGDGAGHRALLGGVGSPDGLAAAVGGALPFWDRSLDLVAPLQDGRDGLIGLVPLVERQPVGLAIAPLNGAEATARRYREALDARQVRHEFVRWDTRVLLGDRVAVQFVPLAADGNAPTARLAFVRGEGATVAVAGGLTALQARSAGRRPADLLIASSAPPEAVTALVAATTPRRLVLAGVQETPRGLPGGLEIYEMRTFRRIDFAARGGGLEVAGTSR